MKLPPLIQHLVDVFKFNNVDNEFLESYRKLLVGQYASLTNPIGNPEAKAEADRISRLSPKDVKWDDLYQMELAMVKLEPLDSLRRRVWILRNEYKEMVSPEEVKDYEASNPPDPAQAPEAALRADAVRLQEELNWRYVVMWVFESFRDHIVRRLAWATGALLLLTFLLICFWGQLYDWFAKIDVNVPLLAMTLVPGVLGGLISTLRRVQAARVNSNADINLSELQKAKASIYLSPLLGGIFALLLFFLFSSSFVTGTLFPKVSFDSLVPSRNAILDHTEVSKLIIWSFIAGFAEKLVPDKLDRLAQENADAAAKSES